MVHVNNDVGQANFVLTVAYDAADAKWGERDGKDTRIAATSKGEEMKHWDFYFLDSVLQDEEGYDVGPGSNGSPEMTTNIGTLDLEDDDPYDLPASKSLWE